MANCVMCGMSIPDGQRTCSMCYGDPDHGKDGYYQAELDRQAREEQDARKEAAAEEASRG